MLIYNTPFQFTFFIYRTKISQHFLKIKKLTQVLFEILDATHALDYVCMCLSLRRLKLDKTAFINFIIGKLF
jgi:hypothetical protein